MKNIINFNLMNLKPTIVLSHQCLEAIKYIVSIAPEEAQWFNTVYPKYDKARPGEIFLHLSDKLYIPKQNTSVTQVDSTSSMMVDFYHELKEDYQDQDTVNEKLNSMTCWCHSHHDMSPSPSGQDTKQFNSFVKSSQEQNQNTWQIMLIFNKKDQFYSRVYDPNTGLVMEGVQVKVSASSYDFDYITKAAKEKFIKPKRLLKYGNHAIKFGNQKASSSFKKPSSFYPDVDISWDTYFQKNDELANQKQINFTIAEEIIYDLFPASMVENTKKITATNKTPKQMVDQLHRHLDDQEMLFLSFVVSQNTLKLKNFWSEAQIESYANRYFNKVLERISSYFSETKDTVENLKDKLTFVFTLTDSPSREEFYNLIKLAS